MNQQNQPPASSPNGKKLLDQLGETLHTKHYSLHIGKTYISWVWRLFLFFSPPTSSRTADTQHLRFWAGVRKVQELLGHKDVKTTMIYTHVLQRGGLVVRSPLDDK